MTTLSRIERLALALCVLTAAAAAPVARAAPEETADPAPPPLKPGDVAPKLQLGKWLKGDPIPALEPGKVYAIDCWATWCGTCVASIPHVTRMQAKYKDQGVVVLGVDVWERDPAAPEPFVKKMGDRMGYAVAADDVRPGEGGRMATTWLKAAGRVGLPCTFLVDRTGRVVWFGDPRQMERPLARLAADTFDPAEQATFDDQLDARSAEFADATKARDHDRALAALDRLAALNPTMASYYNAIRIAILIKKGDYPAANALAAAYAGDRETDDDDSLRATVAFTLANAPDPDRVDAPLALKLATRAYEANDKDNWQYLSLLAKASAANRQFDKAVELQARVLQNAPTQVKSREQATLDEYKQKATEKNSPAPKDRPDNP